MRKFLAVRYLEESKGTLKPGFYNIYFRYKNYKGRKLKCYQVNNGNRWIHVDIKFFKPVNRNVSISKALKLCMP